MDDNRFDRLTRTLATSNSRRAFLRSSLGISGTAVLGALGAAASDASAAALTGRQAGSVSEGLSVREASASERAELLSAASAHIQHNQLARFLNQSLLLGTSGETATLVVERSGGLVRKVAFTGYAPRSDVTLVESLIAVLIAILTRILGGSTSLPTPGTVDGAVLAFGIEAGGTTGSHATTLDATEPWHYLTIKNGQVESTFLRSETGDLQPGDGSLQAWSAQPATLPHGLNQFENCPACQGTCGLLVDVAALPQTAIELGTCGFVGILACPSTPFELNCFRSVFSGCQSLLDSTVGIVDRIGCYGLCEREWVDGCVAECEPQSCSGGQYFDQDLCECRCPLDRPEPVFCNGQCVSSVCDDGWVFDNTLCRCVSSPLSCDPMCGAGQECINGACFDRCDGAMSQCGQYIQCICPTTAEGVGVCINTVEAQNRPGCETSEDCPEGFVCAPTGDGSQICVPPCSAAGGIPRDPCDGVDCSAVGDQCNDGVCDGNGGCIASSVVDGTSCTDESGSAGECQHGSCVADPVTSTYTVDVSGLGPWTDTGIDISTGNAVDVGASGTIKNNAGNPEISPDGQYADGYGPIVPCPYAVALPSAACWSLVGRLGEAPPFAIGNRSTFTATSSGRLHLGVNDEFFPDNSGSWTVSVTVTSR